jgi:hypothetical protein
MARAGTLKLLRVTGPVSVALGAAGLYYLDSALDEGTRRALSMYAAFGAHDSAQHSPRVRVRVPAPAVALTVAADAAQAQSWPIIAGWRPSTRG